jgi:hypothetical protein
MSLYLEWVRFTPQLVEAAGQFWPRGGRRREGAVTVKSAYSIKMGFPKNKFLIGNLMGLVCDKTSGMVIRMRLFRLTYVSRHRKACRFVKQR